MRVLGVDFGGKRIGLAIGETEGQVATPRPIIPAVEGLAANVETLIRVAKNEAAEAFVVGIPFGLGGEETPMAKICLRLAQRLKEEGAVVFEVDESLTSVEAAAGLIRAGGTAAQRRSRLDSEAACRIVERFFVEHEKADA